MKRVLVLLAAVALATPAQASTSGTSKVAVPASGPTTTKPVSWTGTVPVGSTLTDPDLSLTCGGQPSAELYDAHKVHVTVPAGAYNLVKATMTVTVASSPKVNGDFMEVLDPSGADVGEDQQKPEMSVDVFKPMTGDYTVLVCSFIPDDQPDHPYAGQVSVTTKCRAASPCPAARKKRK